MQDALGLALGRFARADPDRIEIVALSVRVSLTDVIVALPLGAFLAVTRFRGREAIITLVNAL